MLQFLALYGDAPDLRRELEAQVSDGFSNQYLNQLFRLYPSQNIQPLFPLSVAAVSSVLIFLSTLSAGIYYYEMLWSTNHISPHSWIFFSAPILLLTLFPFLLSTNILRPLQARRLRQKINEAAQQPPTLQFILHFAQHQAAEVIEQFQETLCSDIQNLQKKLREQQSDLRQAHRLYRGEQHTLMFQTIETTLRQRIDMLERDICRITYLRTRLEDIQDQLHQQAHSVQIKQRQKAHFDKIMQNETDAIISIMKRQQEERLQEMEGSLRSLLRIMSDANHYLDAVIEVDLTAQSSFTSSWDDT